MEKYTVESGVIVKAGKGYKKGETIELTDKQAEGLKGRIKKAEVKETEAAVANNETSYKDMTMEQLKALTDADETIEVVATGKNGAFKKEDYITALEK
ncbi:hypothetical protein J4760_04070 [Salinicoccus sp. ID82-1]|uniref:hypothetical protein n=1 Tax=Salinicoccus sp. ID82-1 TaxID=2820269 RepID=UPI001F1FDC22|nr:hypothetical protein [Salinicoccus sp. ID82-1]MCG1009228.1 hypothetical protein [Salinicoccus sp. ID82-1]